MSNSCQAQSISSYDVQSIGTKQTQRPYFQYLIARNNILYFRISVPNSLQALFCRKEIRYSLRTPYFRQARIRSMFLASKIKNIFEYAKKAISMSIEIDRDKLYKLLHAAFDQSMHMTEIYLHEEMNGEELKNNADVESYLSKEAERIESSIYSSRVTGTTISWLDTARKWALEREHDDAIGVENIAKFISNAIPSAQKNEFSSTIYQIAKMIDRESKSSVLNPSYYIEGELDKLSGDFARIEALAYRHQIKKLHGLFDYAKAHEEIDKLYPRHGTALNTVSSEYNILNRLARMLKNTPHNEQAEKAHSESAEKVATESRPISPTLGQAIEEYRQTIPEKEWKQSYSTAMGNLVEYFGNDILLSNITGDMIRKYALSYNNIPVNRKNDERYRGLHITSFDKVKVASEDKLKYSAVNGYLERVVTLFKTVSIQKHFKTEELVLDHLTEAKGKVVERLKKEQGGKKSRVKPFSCDDLSELFNTVSFKELLDSNNELAWAMLIATYTGMRSGEIAELKPSNIKTTPSAPLHNKSGAPCRDGITFIDLSYSNVKNENSQRLIPLNTFLLEELRLSDFFESRRNSEWLFPSFVNKIGKKDDAISKAFTEYRRLANVGRSKGSDRFNLDNKVLHSFRHTFKHRCDYLNLRARLINEYVGHGSHEIPGEPTYKHELGIDSLFDNVAERLDFHTWIPQIGALVDTMKKVKL